MKYSNRSNYCELFRFHNHYCDVFIESMHYLYVENEPYAGNDMILCKEFHTCGDDYLAGSYLGTTLEYIQTLKHATKETALDIIASEERYTLECMASDYGYSREYVVDAYRECIADGETPHDAYTLTLARMMERDL